MSAAVWNKLDCYSGAVGKVRRAVHRALLKEGINTLKGLNQLWLFHPENLSDIRQIEFKRLRQMELKTSRAWAMKEQFRWFWNYRYAGSAKRFFDKWYDWAIRSQFEPVKKVAVRFKPYLPNILNWCKHRITTGSAEGFNSRIQSIKSAARGFRNFENYRTKICSSAENWIFSLTPATKLSEGPIFFNKQE
jgi:transposase